MLFGERQWFGPMYLSPNVRQSKSMTTFSYREDETENEEMILKALVTPIKWIQFTLL